MIDTLLSWPVILAFLAGFACGGSLLTWWIAKDQRRSMARLLGIQQAFTPVSVPDPEPIPNPEGKAR